MYDDAAKLFGMDPLEAFGLPTGRPRPDLPIPGSPDRCLLREVVQDAGGKLWVLERLFGGQQPRREAVARVLHALDEGGAPGVPAFRRVPGGGFSLERGGGAWQVAPFVAGEPLPRPQYIEEPEQGTALAAWLGRVHAASAALPIDELPVAPASRLPAYVDELLDTAARDHPDIPLELAPVLDALEPFFEQWGDLSRGLCHGDFHPLNVVWQGQEPAAVVDWEFAGLGPALYDAANMLGCVGSEEPTALGRGLCAAFVARLRADGQLDGEAARVLTPLVLAVRFAWLGEWLRRADQEMIDMELVYMRLLANSRPGLERIWGLA